MALSCLIFSKVYVMLAFLRNSGFFYWFSKKWQSDQALAWLMLEQAIISGTNFATVFLLVKAVGFAGLGLYNLMMTTIVFFNNSQNTFISFPMTSLLSTSSSKIEALGVQQTLIVQQLGHIVFSWIVMAAVVSTATAINPAWNLKIYLPALLMLTTMLQVQEFIRRWFMIKEMYRDILIFSGISYFGQLAVLAMCIYSNRQGLDIKLVLLINAYTTFAALVYGFWVSKLYLPRKVPKLHFKDTLNVGGWLGTQNLFVNAAAMLNSYMITYFINLEVLGVIGLVQKLYGPINILMSSFTNYLTNKAGFRILVLSTKQLLGYLYRRVFFMIGLLLFYVAVILFSFSAIEKALGIGLKAETFIMPCLMLETLMRLMTMSMLPVNIFRNFKKSFKLVVVVKCIGSIITVPIMFFVLKYSGQFLAIYAINIGMLVITETICFKNFASKFLDPAKEPSVQPAVS